MTVRYSLGCDLTYRLGTPTTFFFNVEVARLDRHIDLRETLSLPPDLALETYESPALRNRYLKLTAPAGPLTLTYRAEVTLNAYRADPAEVLEVAVEHLPLDIMPFLLPSRYVSSDRLAAFAAREFGAIETGHGRVTAICNWIYDNLAYQRGSTDETTTADEVLLQRAGVCRDFAHLGIAFCRALSIPARFVSCYAYGLEPSDFHAVFEAYLSGRWWLFDATRQANLDGLVRIGIGRDAAEIAFATPFGAFEADPPRITIQRIDGMLDQQGRTAEAISTEEPAADAGAR